MTDTESLLLSCSQEILHDYYEKNEITLLLACMARDITWTGGGSDMAASGRDAVTRFFITTRDKMIPTVLSHEQWISHPLSQDFWLYTVTADLETAPQLQFFLKEHMKCDFLYRRNPEAASGNGWELVHLNNSISYNKLKDKETFAVSEGVKDLWLHNHYGTGMIDDRKKEELFLTINDKVFRYLSEATRKTLTVLSLFDRFSVNKALFMCPDADVPAILSSQEKNGLFLYLNRQTRKYFFFPLMKEFLQSEFQLWSEETRRQYLDKAAHWYYSMGSLPEAMRFASLAKNYELSLIILDKGADSILLAGPRIYPADLLDHIPHDLMKKHMKTVLLMAYDLYFSELHAGYRRNMARIQRLELSLLGQTALTFLEGATAFNHLDTMTSLFAKVLEDIRKFHLEDQFIAPRLGFCCPSFLMMYHSTPGKLKEETEQLIEIQEICCRINRMPHNGTWALYFQMEYAFNTGHFSEAEDALSTLEATESYREDLSIQIRCLHYQAMHSYFHGDTAGLKESRKKLHELMNTAQPFQALLARMSDESLEIILPSREGGDRQNQAINSSMFYFPALTFLHIVEDERLVHPGNGRTLLASARRHEKLARQRRSLIGEIHALLHQAIACDMLHENAQCLEAMEKALRLAEPDHLIIPFLTVKNRLASRWAHLKASPASSLLKDIMDSRFESVGQILEKEIHLDQLSKKLTAREMGIIRLVMKGRTNKEIAAEMNVAEITIKKALSLIYKKLDIKNRAQLVGMFKKK